VTLSREREIHTATSSLAPRLLLQSVFAAELVLPSRPLWLVSPWISDMEILDNRARQFASLCPDWPALMIRLSRVLETLLVRGGKLMVVTTETKPNRPFLDQISRLEQRFGQDFTLIFSENLHEKVFVGDRFSISGSMNLTYRGVYVNEEFLSYTCEPARVKERRLSLEARWSKVR